MDRSLWAVLAGHLHAALQHRAHRRDADLLPGRPRPAPRRPRPAPRPGAGRPSSVPRVRPDHGAPSTSRSSSSRRSSASCPTGAATGGSCSSGRCSASSPSLSRGPPTNIPLILGTRLLEGAATAASIPSILGFIAVATAFDEGLRGQGRRALRGGNARRAPRRLRRRRPAVHRSSARGVPRERRDLHGLARDLPLRRRPQPRGVTARRRTRAAPARIDLSRYRQILGRTHVWLLAPDLDRGQRGRSACSRPRRSSSSSASRTRSSPTSC